MDSYRKGQLLKIKSYLKSFMETEFLLIIFIKVWRK